MTEVIALFLIGILLIVLNFNAIRKDKKSFSGMLKHKENNMQDYEIEIGKIRRDLSETVLELQQEIEALKLEREDKPNRNEIKQQSKNVYEAKEKTEKTNKENFREKKVVKEEKNDKKNYSHDNNNNVGKKPRQNKNYVNKTNNDLNKYAVVDDNNKSNDNNVKVTEIKAMLDKGLSVDEVAEKIGIGKGEVLLIKELYIK